MIYFDHNATTTLDRVARSAWGQATANFIANPSSPHRLGSRVEAALAEARERFAGLLGCDPLDVVWTSGATEANNLVLHHFARELEATTEVWVSAIEHPSVLAPARHYFANRLCLMPVTRGGVIDLDWLKQQLGAKRPGLVTIMAANNETGVLQPWRKVMTLCWEYDIPVFCDATQWLGRLPARELGRCDFVTGSGHKFGAPKGVGFVKCPPRGRVHPLLLGGGQQEGRRAGTENVPGVLAMVAALEAREAALLGPQAPAAGQGAAGVDPSGPASQPAPTPVPTLEERLAWRSRFEDKLVRWLPSAEIVGAGQERLWNTVSALMPEADCQQRWVVKLDKLGFAVSTGSACASGREKPSHVIAAMGYSPAEAGRVLRFSSGWDTPEQHWQMLLEALHRVYVEIPPAPAE